LGFAYSHGQGVLQDYGQAIQWYRKAADQGDAVAQATLGSLYEHGQGVPQDYAQAAQWFRKAADQGVASAQNNLGFLYEHGQGVPRDYDQATQWSRKAAQQGHAGAQARLGLLYATGHGMPQNRVVAYALFNLATAQNSSIKEGASMVRAALAKRMTEQEIKAGQALSQEMSRPGNLLKALDQYLAASGINSP
jgi:hypothetical protein